MSLNAGSPIRLSSSNGVAHFANLTPKKSSKDKWGIIGLLRILGLVGEIGLTILLPEFTPLIIGTGTAFQEGLDIYSFADTKHKDRRAKLSFAAGTAVNVIPLFGVARTLRATENVLRIADKEAKTGFRYIVKGVDRGFERSFNQLAKTGQRSGLVQGRSISRISVNQERALITRKVIPPKYQRKVIDDFEKGLQAQFGDLQTAEKVIATAGGKRYYSHRGDFIYTNRDIAILRNEIKALALDKRTVQQLMDNLKGLSSTAKDAMGLTVAKGKGVFKSNLRRQQFASKIDDLKNIYTQEFAENLVSNANKPWWKRSIEWFGKDAKEGKPIWTGGTFWTQAGQLANPNDMAREMMNRPLGALLHGELEFAGKSIKVSKNGGLKGWAKGVRESLEAKAPKLAKIMKLPLGKRLVAKYEAIKKALTEKGTLTKDDTFLMGWKVLKYGSSHSEVLFYFNPIKTNAKTRGSKNFGGKRAVQAIIRTSHLKYLAKTETPGHAYLKGEGGFPPIALSAGGRRAVIFELASETLELATLYMPLGGIRNVLSLISNAKNVARDVRAGVYGAKWVSTFKNTFTRLLPNKITRLLGQTVGSVVSDEMGAHLSRLLKNVGQGFQKTKTSTFYRLGDGTIVQGHRGMRRPKGATKFQTRKTKFSFHNKFNWRPLVKQGVPLSIKSAALRRAPKGTALRRNIQGQRIGKNLRRPLGIVGLT